MPRGKRPSVDPALRRKWLKLYEEDGWTPPQIAREHHYDVRTVRNYLNMETEEAQKKQATLMYYHDALREHYRDLTGLAQTFANQVSRDEPITLDPETDFLLSALKEHMKRSPIWAKVDKWNANLQKIKELGKRVQDKINKEVESNNNSRSLSKEIPKLSFGFLANVLDLQFRRWSKGLQPLDFERDFGKDDAGNGLVQPHIGDFKLDPISPEKAEKLRRIILDFESRMKQWEELVEMGDLLQEKDKIGRELNTELSYIIYRRVIPGKCRYCPW
jgi:hypothetical protein